MNRPRRTCFTLTVVLLLACSLAVRVSAQDELNIELEIAGLPIKVIRDWKSKFQTQFIEVVIPNDQYSKDNLIKVWKHYCEKYPDKKVRLDLRVFTNETYEYNKQFDTSSGNAFPGNTRVVNGIRLERRGYEAKFDRMGDGALAYGGDNELLIYAPDLSKPTEKERIILAGKDPYKPQ